MKRIQTRAIGSALWALCLATPVLLLAATSAHAALINRGGGMIYDTELNITWLQDWNHAKTSGYSAGGVAPGSVLDTNTIWTDGRMGWDAANSWANNLVHGGFDDWRLPTMADTGAAGCDFSYAGGTDCGYNVQTRSGSTVYSELAHLWYETLGNLASCAPGDATCAGGDPQSGWGLNNTGPFTNMQHPISLAQDQGGYWLGLQHPTTPFSTPKAWAFGVGAGSQVPIAMLDPMFAVAVRHGDVTSAAPEPQTLAMVLLALGVTVLTQRKRPFQAAA